MLQLLNNPATLAGLDTGARMDRNITVRFFKISKVHPAGPSFEDALHSTFALGAHAYEREREASGRILRLERLAPARGFLVGEVVRKQTENIPPEANMLDFRGSQCRKVEG